jgi:putative transposase
MMQDVGRRYVSYINRTYRRSGTLWEGRFKASLVDSERYLLVCMRYIELNPVRANMVEHPGEYAWSSYHCNAWGEADELIQEHPLYIDMGYDSGMRQYNYRELFKAHMDASIIHDVREALNRELVLGREDFKERIEEMTKRQTRPAAMGRPKIREESGVNYVM